jgi:urease accessory protein
MGQAGVTARAAEIPRSLGSLKLSTKMCSGVSVIDRFRTSGATKVAFPSRVDVVEAIILNTSGGLTGGDRFEANASAGPETRLALTTQAAERAYRSRSGSARISTRLEVGDGATLHWLPQELIVFDGAAIERRLDIHVAPRAEAVIVEPIVFGRRAMGETRISGTFRDRITLYRNGTPIYRDRIDLSGRIADRLDRLATAGGMTAVATIMYCGPAAELHLPKLRALLPSSGGASIVTPGLLMVRLLAEDAFLLRKTLVPLLECLSGAALPKSWSL